MTNDLLKILGNPKEIEHQISGLQELILYTTLHEPREGLSDFEREELMCNQNQATKLLYKMRKLHLKVKN